MSNRDWSGEPTKAVPVGADKILILDSEATNINKLVSLTDLAVTGAWTHNAASGFTFLTVLLNKVGIGLNTLPAATLHVRTLLAGSDVPSADADDFIIENNGNTGYTVAPTVTIDAPPTPVTATATATTTGGVRNISMLVNGTRYLVVPAVVISGGGGSGATATAILQLDNVETILVSNGGSGFSSAPTVVIDAPTGGAPIQATATAILSGDAVISVTVTNEGRGYPTLPAISFSGGGGTGAVAFATLSSQVDSITVTNKGTGYTSEPTVTIDASPNGTDATAAGFVGNFVDSIIVNTIGSGYVSAPTVTIDAPTGGAAVQAVADTTLINTEVTVINITEGGNGYDSVPAVSFTAAPSAVTATADANIAGGKVISTTITNGGVGYKVPPPNVTITGGDGTGAGVDDIVVGSSAIVSITITAGGTGMTIFNDANQVGVIDFEHAGGPTQHGRIMYDHGTETMRFLNTGVQGLLVDNEGHVAITPDNAPHPENFTVASDELNHPTRILVADTFDRLLMGYTGVDPFTLTSPAAQVIVPGNTGDLAIASRGNLESKIQLYTSAGSALVLAMTVASNGFVGVGTSAPVGRLEVAGTSGSTDFRISRIGNPDAHMFLTARGGAFNNVVIGNSLISCIAMRDNRGVAVCSFGNQGTEIPDDAFLVGGVVGVGTITPDISALVDLTSTTQGFLHPRMTEAQRDAISTPAEALIISNNTKRTLDCFSTPDWRSFGTQGVGITEVWALADFPAPSAGVITINNGTDIIQKSISLSDRFVMADTQNVTFRSSDRQNNIVTYTGTDTLFTAPNNTTFDIFDMNSLLTGNNATYLDFTKGNSNIERITVTWSGTGGAIGNITNTFLPLLDDMVYTGFETGIVVRDFANFQFRNVGLFPSQASTGPFVNISGRAEFAATIGRGGYSTGINNSCFFISPDLVGLVVMEDVVNQGVGQFYQTAPTGTFSAASDEAATNAISSVSDNGGTAVFDKGSALTNILDNDIVVHTTFSEGTYNGTFEIFASAANTYQVRNAVTKVAVSFVATGTGTGTTELTRFTATAHGLSIDDAVLPNSTNYTIGERIRGTPLTNSFDLRVPFVADEAGTWQVDLGTFTAASDENFAKTITAVALAPADGSTPAGIRLTVSGGTSPMLDRDVVINTGFTDSAYNGTFVVSNVQSGTFDLVSRSQPIIFTATDTGTSTDQVTRFTSINHGLVNLQGVQLKSNSYNLGAGIRGTPAVSTFDLPISFVADESGTTNVNSLDQTDPRLTVRDCTGSPDSVTEGEFSFINIATPETVTIVTEAVPVAINGGAWTASNLERILEPSGGDGIAVYNGLEDIEVAISFFCLLEKVGGGATDIGCTILVNDIDVIANHPHSVNAGIIQISGNAIVTLNTGDTIQMAVLNDSGTANIDVSQANMILSKGT